MARFTNGWVRIEKRMIHEDIGQNPICAALWVWLLTAAVPNNIEQTKIRWRGGCKILKSGDVLFSLTKLSEQWEVSKSVIHRHLKYLQSTERLKYESSPDGCVVTICNWKKYQEDFKEDAGGHKTPEEHEENVTRTRREHEENVTRTIIDKVQLTINKEHNTEEYNTLPISEESDSKDQVNKKKQNDILSELWNTYCGKLPKVRGVNQSRMKKIRARLLEEPNEDYWIQVIQRIADSKFCNGQNEHSWVASFDFLIQPETHLKAIEGKYDNRELKSKRPMTFSEVRAQANQEQLEKILRGEL